MPGEHVEQLAHDWLVKFRRGARGHKLTPAGANTKGLRKLKSLPPPDVCVCVHITGGGGLAEGRQEQVDDFAHDRRAGGEEEEEDQLQREGQCEGEVLAQGGAEAQEQQVENNSHMIGLVKRTAKAPGVTS